MAKRPEDDSLASTTPTSGQEIAAKRASPTPALASSKKGRFADPKSDDEVKTARERAIPEKTRQNTLWCVNQWSNWVQYRRQQHTSPTHSLPDNFREMSDEELNYWVPRFILEARKRDGACYPPESLYQLVCGLQRYLHQNGRPEVKLVNGDPHFYEVYQTLDAEMKRLKSMGLGAVKKQAEPITEEEEELLWSKGLLGDHSPRSLVNTMVYMCGLFFALRSGDEHRRLRYKLCQIEVVEDTKRPYLIYREDISKNHPGGVKGRKQTPKIVHHYANTSNPNRCFVRLFKLYNSLCPPNRPECAFYLQPLAKPSQACWFSKAPIGHGPLGDIIATMCKQAGIPGYRTNHSLRATAATRLYHKGADEQQIMEVTGHSSLDGVRSYKRTSKTQQIAISDMLSTGNQVIPQERCPSSSSTLASRNISQSVNTWTHDGAPKLVFNSCSNITININNAKD